MIRVFTSAHATADKFIWTRLEHEAGVSAGEHRRTEGRQKWLYYLINQFNYFICLLSVFHCFGIRYFNFVDFISPSFFFLCSKSNVLIYTALPNECVCFVLPVFCHNKVPDFLFHLKKRKVGEAVKERPCWKLSSHLKGTGIRRFLTIKNPLDDLRQ